MLTWPRRLAARRADLPVLAEATFWLWVAWAALALLPFRRVAAALRPRVRGKARRRADAADRVAWAVETAARHVPWRAVCFHQGIAAQRMLARRGIAAELHYGVRKGEADERPAHVWVGAEGRIVLGGEDIGLYARLATFSSRSA